MNKLYVVLALVFTIFAYPSDAQAQEVAGGKVYPSNARESVKNDSQMLFTADEEEQVEVECGPGKKEEDGRCVPE